MTDPIIIYCDGACTNNGKPTAQGSWGATMSLGKHYKEFSAQLTDDLMTNNRAEMYAVINAIKQLQTDQYQVIIYTDSKYITECFAQCWYRHWEEQTGWKSAGGKPIANKDLWLELLGLWVFYDIDFVYQSDDNPGIKKAHELAQQALNN